MVTSDLEIQKHLGKDLVKGLGHVPDSNEGLEGCPLAFSLISVSKGLLPLGPRTIIFRVPWSGQHM